MAYTVILHLMNAEPVMGEIEELPSPTDQIVLVNNPRMMDGKDVHYLATNVTSVIWPISRLTFIELMPSEEEDRIIGFVREG